MPDMREASLDACEGTVRVDLQLVLPSVAQRTAAASSKTLPPTAAACASDCIANGDNSSSYASSYASSSDLSSQDSQAGNVEQETGSVIVQVGPPNAAAAAAAPPANTQQAQPAQCCSAGHSSSQGCSIPGSGPAPVAGGDAGSDDAEDEGLCTICYDNQATCVLMECGHGGYCWRCAHVLFARPPSECPVCRQKIMQVCSTYRECQGLDLQSDTHTHEVFLFFYLKSAMP
jgi:hypothetical protein